MFEFSPGESVLLIDAIMVICAVMVLGLCNPDFNNPDLRKHLKGK